MIAIIPSTLKSFRKMHFTIQQHTNISFSFFFTDLLIELTGDYVASFLMAGSLQMCSGILMLTSMGIERYQKGRKQTKMTAHNVEVELAPLQIDENEKLDNAPST